MVLRFPWLSRPPAAALAAVAAVAVLCACAPPPAPSGMNDPDEAKNREIHAVNRAMDRALLNPASGVYGSILPEPVRIGVSNFGNNLDIPGDVANNILQGRLGKAVENSLRFVVNSTVGLGGLFDPASAIGLAGDTTDFGETLHVWGVPEGAYQELPLLGPSTDRDTVGRIVDVALNPVRLAFPGRVGNAATVAGVASTLGDRYRFAGTVESILYDSADSYAQARLLYLQNRRYELGQTAGDAAGGEEAFLDPYEDPYAP